MAFSRQSHILVSMVPAYRVSMGGPYCRQCTTDVRRSFMNVPRSWLHPPFRGIFCLQTRKSRQDQDRDRTLLWNADGCFGLSKGSSPEILARNEVSVIVVNHNAGAFLDACVQGALNQAREVIVVDNASTDGSCSGTQNLLRSEGRLKLAFNSQNVGFSVACNMGVALASGKYLLFLNPDCMIEPGALGKMLGALEHERHAGMVGGFLINPDGTEQAGGRRAVPTPWRSFVRAFGLSRFRERWPRLFASYDLCAQPVPAEPVEVEAVSGACMLVRREALDDVGQLDEGYFMHCEDLDWCMRFRQKDWKVFFVPGARVIHHLGVCSRARPVFVEWHKHKGMVRFYRKFFSHQYPGPLLVAVVGAVWVRFLAKVMAIQAKRLFGKS